MITAKVLSIDTYPAGSAVSDTPAVGRLPVYDVWDFPADGGTVLIEGVVYAYDAIDVETSELVGGSLPSPAVDTDVLVDPYSETKYALVDPGDDGDGLQALIPHSLAALLEDGQRDPGNAETVTVDQTRPGIWQLADVLDQRAELTPDAGALLPGGSDGLPPATSPDPTAIGGIGAVFLRWVALDNPDFVTYAVHVSTTPDYIPDETTLVALTSASSLTVRTDGTGAPLAYDTAYYFAVVASDEDGSAAPSAVASAMLFKVTGPDIAVDYVYAGNIIADQIIGGTINSDLLLAGAIKTAVAGARVELGPFGIVVYNPAGTPTTLLGSDGTSTFKGSVQASTLSVTDGMSIRGTANELAQAATLTLAAGVSASPNAPTVINDWEVLPGWKQSNGDPWPAGYEFKTMQRVGTKWVVGARRTSDDLFFVRTFNDDGTFDAYYGTGWAGQQIQRGAWISSTYPAYGFRQTDRRIIAATHSVSGAATVNSLAWDFTSGQPAGTTEEGTVSYPSGRCRLSVTAAVGPASSLNNAATMDMRGQRVTAQVWKVGTFNQPGQRIELRMRNAGAGEYILARIEGDDTLIHFQTYNGSAGSTKITTAPRPADGYYWRMIESNGDALLQTSANGVSWSNVATITDHGLTDADLASMTLSLIVDDADDGTATTGEFDNVTVGYGFSDFGDAIPWVDTSNPPALGTDGTYILAAERTSDNRIKIYEIDPRSPGRIVTTYTSGISTDFAFVTPLVTVAKGSFDFGSTRFVVTTGNSGDQWAAVFTVSGTTLTYQRNESFYVYGQAGTGWDGTVFQTLGTDGTRQKHTAITWTDVPDWAKTWYAATTWYDGDATGGTHETTCSPRAAFSLKKRSRYTVTSGDIPDLGGTDDPDRIRIYLASSAVATMWRQATTAAGINSAVLTTATFSGTAAPVSNDFPDAIAAQIVNADGTLTIDGSGTLQAVTGAFVGVLTAGATTVSSLEAPLVTAGRVVYTDRTFAQVIATALEPVPTTLTDVPGLTSTVDVDSTGDIYLVMATLDVDLVAVAPAFPFEVRLMVNAVLQTPNGYWRAVSGSAAGQRATVSQQWLITGQAAGNQIFKIQVRAAGGGGTAYRVNAVHSQMTIVQQQ